MTGERPPHIRILGVPVGLVDMARATETVLGWATDGEPHTVFLREVAGLMLARDEPRLLALHHEASLVAPDGMPLVWVARLRGHGRAIGRVAGADLVDAVCAASLRSGQSHFFYGGKPSIAEAMAAALAAKYPGLRVAGTLSPPLRTIGPDFEPDAEGFAEIATIKASGADFIWVGLSSPKQEYWLMQAAPLIGKGVLLGVGAAFDFHSQAIRRAPKLLRDNGFEWLYRFCREPRRLWRRYLVAAPRFVVLAGLEVLRERR